MFEKFYNCFHGEHLVFFLLSLISTIIVLILTHIFLIFYYHKNEDKTSSIIKHLIIDREKIFYYSKVYLVILETIGYEYNIKGLLSFSFLLCSLINVFFCFKENSFKINSQNVEIVRLVLFGMNFISNLSLFMFYLFRKYNVKGFSYMFILFSLILMGNIVLYNKQLFILTYKNFLNLKEIEVYNQLCIILKAIQEKKKNRKQLLHLISYFSVEIRKNLKDIENIKFFGGNEKKNEYILYIYIEKIFKKKVELFNNSILLKLTYSDFLYNIIKKYKKAYQTIYQLYSDIENNYIFSSISQSFFVYRIKRELEERSINNINDGSDISFQYQCHSLMKFISQISEVYFEFWNLLLTSSQKEDLNKLDEYGNEIIQLKNIIDKKYEAISNSKFLTKKITQYYILYLREIIKDNEKAEIILSKLDDFKNTSYEEQLNFTNIYDIENIFPSSHFQFMIISLDKSSIGNILKISSDFSGKIGYTSNELIGHNLSILIPSFLKEEHQKIIENLLKEEIYFIDKPKSKKFIVYIKTKSRFLLPIPIEIIIIKDEDRNPFILGKIDDESEIMGLKNIRENYHIMVNHRLIIKYYTVNCIKGLLLNNKTINNHNSIIHYIREIYSEIIKILSDTDEEINKIKLQISIIKDYYMGNELQKVTWSKNNRNYLMNCEEIKMNDKIMGYIFNFQDIKEFASSLLNQSNITNRRISVDLLNSEKRKTINKEDFKIKGDFIPSNNEKIDFDYKEKEYVFIESNNNNEIETVVDFFNNKNKNENKNQFIESSDVSSGFSLNQRIFDSEESEEDEEEEIKESDEDSSNFEPKNNNKNEQIESSVKFNIERKEVKRLKTIKEKRYTLKQKTIGNIPGINECAYKVDLSKITFYRYNYKTNNFDDLKKMYNSSKFEEKMGFEISLSDKLKKQKTVKKKNPFNKMMKLTFSRLFLLPKIKKMKKKEILRNAKLINNYMIGKKCNFSVKILIIIFIIFFLNITIFYIYIFSLSLYTRTDIVKIGKINRYLSNLRDNTNDIFYQSFQLAILNNPHYYNFNPPRETLKRESKEQLLKIYEENLELIKDLSSYKQSLPKKYLNILDNYEVDVYSITFSLNTNVTSKKITNLLSEITYCVFNYAISDDEDIHLRNLDYNFILYNSRTFYSKEFESYLKIYLNIFNEKKNLTTSTIIILTICFILFGFLLIYFIYIANKYVTKDKQKILKLFFQIDMNNIKQSLIKCEKFMDKEKSWSAHSNSKYSIENENESSNESDLIFTDEGKIKDLIKNKEKPKKKINLKDNNKNKVIIPEKGTNNLIYVMIIIILILCFILINLSLYLKKTYQSFYHYTMIYFLLQSHKTIYSKYFNYVRMYITYYHKENDPFLENIKMTLFRDDNNFFSINTYYLKEFTNYVQKYGLPSSAYKLFASLKDNDLCKYYENYSISYNIGCDYLGDGVVRKGIVNILNYGIHSILYVKKSIELAIEKANKKGYKYNEVYYGTELYKTFYPQNESEWEEYEKLNPFNKINGMVVKNLTILTEIVYRNASFDLINLIKQEIINGFEEIQNIIIISCSIFGIFAYLPIILYFIPDITRKNIDINKKRKLLAVIPKEMLSEMIYKNEDEF